MASVAQASAVDELSAFRSEVQAFIAENFPAELKGRNMVLASVEGPSNETAGMQKWREAMGARGWGTPSWPSAYGGGGLNRAQARILETELAQAGAYNPIAGMGVMMYFHFFSL